MNDNMSNNRQTECSKLGSKLSETSINKCNITTFNVEKGFIKKSNYIWNTLRTNNTTIALIVDLGLTEYDLQKHFTKKGVGKYEGKGYILPGYTLFVNEWETETRVAIALNETAMETKKNIHITYSIEIKELRGRLIEVGTKLTTGENIVFQCIYAPNTQQENALFMGALVEKIIKHKYNNRVVVVGGDFNASRTPLHRFSGHEWEHNEWLTDLDTLLVDGATMSDNCIPVSTWDKEGDESIAAVLDYILVDNSLAKFCKTYKLAEETKAISDHKAVTLYTGIPLVLPKTTIDTFQRIIDINKINAETKNKIQQDMCVVSNSYLEILDEILNSTPSMNDATDFYNIINKLALEMQEIGLKHCPADTYNKNNNLHRPNWDKKLREWSKHVSLCEELIKNADIEQAKIWDLRYTQFAVSRDAATTSTPNIMQYYRNVKKQIKTLMKENTANQGWTGNRNNQQKWEKYNKRIRELAETIEKNKLRDSDDIETPFPGITLNKRISAALNKIGVVRWEQIENWDGTDIMPLSAFKRLAKEVPLEPVTWAKMREYYKEQKVSSNFKHPARRWAEVEEELVQKTVLVTIESNKPIRMLEWRRVWSVNWTPYGKHKFYKTKAGEWHYRLACLIHPEQVDIVLKSIKSVLEDTKVYVTVSKTRPNNNLIDKTIELSQLKWEKTDKGDNTPLDKIRNANDILPELKEDQQRTIAQRAIDYKKTLKLKIQERIREINDEKIKKAVNAQISRFKKHPSKYIKNKRAKLEGKIGAKLLSIKDNEGEHTTKEGVQQSTHSFYTSTGSAKIVKDNTDIDFIKLAQETGDRKTGEEELIQNITHTEVISKIFSSANKTAPGADGIPYEFLKAMPDCFFKMVTKIFNIMYMKGYCPMLWKAGDVFLLAKTADPVEHKNWRPICLQSTLYKILMAIMSDRMLKYALTNNIISEEQKGFCPVSGCFDHAGLLLNIIENFRQNNKKLYLAFIDFTNAYGSVDHGRLVSVIKALSFPEQVANFIKSTLDESSYVVHTGYGPTDPIKLLTGLKQGDPCAPVLFILFIEILIRALKSKGIGYKFEYPFKTNIPPSLVQAFCDDFLITTDDVREMDEAMGVIEQFEEWSGMEVNHGKCGVMSAESNKTQVIDLDITFTIRGINLPYLKRYQTYKYLGNAEALKGTPYAIEKTIQEKLDNNIKLIDSTALPPVYKVQLAEWLIASIPMYYLANGRVRASRLKKWTKKSRQMVRKWLMMGNICNSAIHADREHHGMGIPEFEEIDEERKVTIFAQFCTSNDQRLKNSTIANLRWELGKRGTIANKIDVLKSEHANTKDPKRKFTLLSTVEKYLIEMDVSIKLDHCNTKCFCVYTNSFEEHMFPCRECGNETHVNCDKIGSRILHCARCRLRPKYLYKIEEIEWKPTYYQNNRYNWKTQTPRFSNPIWDYIINQDCENKHHHVFQHGNGVWGITEKQIKIHTKIKITTRDIPQRSILDLILVEIRKHTEEGNLLITLNNRIAYETLSAWAPKWSMNYQRTTIGAEPAAWEQCRQILELVKKRLPFLTMFKHKKPKKTDEYIDNWVSPPEEEYTELWIHNKGKQLTPITIAKIIKNYRAEKWIKEWSTKKIQGAIIRNNPNTLQYTTHY